MNAIVIHGDSLTRIAEQVYFIVNEQDDYLRRSRSFSYLNVMLRSKECEKAFDIRGWEMEESKRLFKSLDLETGIYRDEGNSYITDVLGRKRKISEVNWDRFIYLLLKTGVRLSEGLGLTPNDFNFADNTVNVSKTWNYKEIHGSFAPIKNKSSIRKIKIDSDFANKFKQVLVNIELDKPIFVPPGKRVYNSTINNRLEKLCTAADIPVVTIHSLRHTHGSILLASGVSILSISKRLGHSNVTTTQEVYMHLIKELEDKDNDKIMLSMANLV